MPRRLNLNQPSQEHQHGKTMPGLRPTRRRAVEANLNGRHSTMLLCGNHYRQLVRQQSAPFRRWKPCSARAAFISRTSSAVTSSASATTRRQLPPIPMTWSMPRLATRHHQVRVRRAVAAVGTASRISEQSEALLREPPNTLPFGRSGVDTEHLLLALTD